MRIIYAWLIVLTVGLMLLFYIQRQAEYDFQSHWHFFPKSIQITVDEPRLSDNIPYHLTPSIRKKTRESNPTYLTGSQSYVTEYSSPIIPETFVLISNAFTSISGTITLTRPGS